MKIDFTETEQPERDFFEAALAEHDLRFLTGLVEVEADAKFSASSSPPGSMRHSSTRIRSLS